MVRPQAGARDSHKYTKQRDPEMLQKTYQFFTKRVGIVNADGSGHSADPNSSRLHCASGRRGRRTQAILRYAHP